MMPRAQRRNVRGGEGRALQQGAEHGRHAVQRGAALPGDGGERGRGVERLGGRDQASARAGAGEVAQDHPEAVVERHGDAHPVRLGVAQPQGGEPGVVEDVAMGQARALGVARGARGVLDVDDVVERQAGLDGLHVALGHAPALVEQSRPIAVEAQQAAGRLGFVQDRGVGPALEAVGVQQQRHARLPQDEGQLAGPVGRVDVHEDRPDAGRGVLRHHPLGAVAGPDADAVAGPGPPRQQAARRQGGLVPQLAVGQAHALPGHHQGVLAGAAGHGAAQVVADRLAQQGRQASAVAVGEHGEGRSWGGGAAATRDRRTPGGTASPGPAPGRRSRRTGRRTGPSARR